MEVIVTIRAHIELDETGDPVEGDPLEGRMLGATKEAIINALNYAYDNGFIHSMDDIMYIEVDDVGVARAEKLDAFDKRHEWPVEDFEL